MQKREIIGVFSLIDPMSLLALHRSRFESEGVKIIGLIMNFARCLDKWQMYKWLLKRLFVC